VRFCGIDSIWGGYWTVIEELLDWQFARPLYETEEGVMTTSASWGLKYDDDQLNCVTRPTGALPEGRSFGATWPTSALFRLVSQENGMEWVSTVSDFPVAKWSGVVQGLDLWELFFLGDCTCVVIDSSNMDAATATSA